MISVHSFISIEKKVTYAELLERKEKINGKKEWVDET